MNAMKSIGEVWKLIWREFFDFYLIRDHTGSEIGVTSLVNFLRYGSASYRAIYLLIVTDITRIRFAIHIDRNDL